MGKRKHISRGPGAVTLLLVTIMILILVLTTGCKQTASNAETVSEAAPPIETATPTESIDLEATTASKIKMTEDASATAEKEATKAALAGRRATAAAKATSAEQERLDAAATERAKPTSTPSNTPLPTLTNTPEPTDVAVAPPVSDRLVRNPGDKTDGDHPINIRNKTGGNVTILMDGDLFKYQFNVPTGNYKIFLRPGYYFYTVYLCGGQLTGSHQFNANWTWKLSCN